MTLKVMKDILEVMNYVQKYSTHQSYYPELKEKQFSMQAKVKGVYHY